MTPEQIARAARKVAQEERDAVQWVYGEEAERGYAIANALDRFAELLEDAS